MNYHLMIDHFFIDNFIEIADKVAPEKNTYIFPFTSPGKYVKSNRGITAPYGSPILKDVVKRITVEDRVYIHWFQDIVMEVIDEIKLTIPVYLFFWGGDFIEQSKHFNNFNSDFLTLQYVKKNEKNNVLYWTKNPFNYFRMVCNFVFFKERKWEIYKKESAIRKRFLQRLNYFCHWNILDFEIVNKAYGSKPTFLNFFYSAELEKIESFKKQVNSCTTIWLGNSDTETNNHLDAIYTLSSYRNNDLKIICPLSYGNKKYGDFVSTQGKLIFADNWLSIRNFMSLDKYLELFNEIDIVVMYHNRTQAAGNIFAFIKMGKKVFLKKQSTIYQLMENNGIVVYDSNTIKDIPFEEFSKPLTENQIQSNVEKISNLFSEEKRLEYLNKILN